METVIACGEGAKQAIDKFAEALDVKAPAEPLNDCAEAEALVWERRRQSVPTVVTFAPGITKPRAIRSDVGRLLRRA